MNWSILFSLPALFLASCQKQRPVGFIGTLSGPSSELGVSGRDGARLYVEEQGAILLTCDDRAVPEQASRCVQRLADSGVAVVIGPMTSGLMDSAIAAATRSGLILVSPTVSADRFNGRDDAMIRVIGTNLDQADSLAGYLRSDGIRHALILWERRNETYTRPVADRIVSTLDKFRHDIACAATGYLSNPDLNFDSLVETHRDADAFVIAGSAMDAAMLARAVRRNRSKARLYGSQFAMGNDLIKFAGPDAEGMVIAAAANHADSTPSRREFTARFQQRFLRAPSFSSSFAWEAASISRIGWSAATGEEAKRRILAQPPSAPLADTLTLDRHGDTRRRIVAHQILDGKYQVLR